MKEYRIYLYTKNQIQIDQIEKLILTTHKLGFTFKYKGATLSRQEAFELLSNNIGHIEIFKDYGNYFFIDLWNKKLEIESTFLRSKRLTQFKHLINPDTISLLRLYLHLTNSFLLGNARVVSDLNFFSNLESPTSHEYIDPPLATPSAQKQAEEPNAIHAYVFISREEPWLDAGDITKIADNNDYDFIENLDNQESINFYGVALDISESIEENSPKSFYLKVEDFIMKLTFNDRLISLYPVKPFKMKTVNNETAIDLAFYLTIYLNLIEPFGIDDLITTFSQKLEFDIESFNTIIKMHRRSWDLVEDYFSTLNAFKEFKYLKDLDKVLALDLNKLDKIMPKNNKEAILEIKSFLQNIKAGNEIGKQLGKTYIFSSRYPIPYVIKKWLKKNKIMFKESNYYGRWFGIKKILCGFWNRLTDFLKIK